MSIHWVRNKPKDNEKYIKGVSSQNQSLVERISHVFCKDCVRDCVSSFHFF